MKNWNVVFLIFLKKRWKDKRLLKSHTSTTNPTNANENEEISMVRYVICICKLIDVHVLIIMPHFARLRFMYHYEDWKLRRNIRMKLRLLQWNFWHGNKRCKSHKISFDGVRALCIQFYFETAFLWETPAMSRYVGINAFSRNPEYNVSANFKDFAPGAPSVSPQHNVLRKCIFSRATASHKPQHSNLLLSIFIMNETKNSADFADDAV